MGPLGTILIWCVREGKFHRIWTTSEHSSAQAPGVKQTSTPRGSANPAASFAPMASNAAAERPANGMRSQNPAALPRMFLRPPVICGAIRSVHKLGPSVSAVTATHRPCGPQRRDARPLATAGERRAACSRARVRLPSGSRAERWKVHEALNCARAEDGADFEACASATAGDRLCALLLALERRHWQLHQPAPDAHSWLACSCRRVRARNAANCISRGCRLARRALESARSAGKCTSRGRA